MQKTAVILVFLVVSACMGTVLAVRNTYYLLNPGDRLVGVYLEKYVFARKYIDKTMDNLAWNTQVAFGLPGKYVIRIKSATLYRFEPVNVSGLFLNVHGEWINDTVETLDVENTGINYNYSVSYGDREIHRLLYWSDIWNSKAELDIYLYHYTKTAGSQEFWKQYYLGLYAKDADKLVLLPSDYRVSEIYRALTVFTALLRGTQGVYLTDIYDHISTTDNSIARNHIAVVPLDYMRTPLYLALKNRVEGLMSPNDIYVFLMDKPLIAVKVYNTTDNWTGKNVVISGHLSSLMILLNLTDYYVQKYNMTGYNFYKILLADVYVPNTLTVRTTLRYTGIVGIVYKNKTVRYVYVDDDFTVYSRGAKILRSGIRLARGQVWEVLRIPLTTLELNSRLWEMIARHYDLRDAVAVYIDESGLRVEKLEVSAKLVVRAYKIIEPVDTGAGVPIVDALVVDKEQSDPYFFLKVDWNYANRTWFSAWFANISSSARITDYLVERSVDWKLWKTSFEFTLLLRDAGAVPEVEVDVGYIRRAPLYGYYDDVSKLYVVDYVIAKPVSYMFTYPIISRRDLKEIIGFNNTYGEWYGYISYWGIPAWKMLPNASQVYAYDTIRIVDAPKESSPVMMYSVVRFTRFSEYITENMWTLMKRHYYYESVDYIYEYSLSPHASYEETLVFYPHERVLRFVTVWEDYDFVAKWFEKLTGQTPSLIQGLPIRGVLSSSVLYEVLNSTTKKVLGTYRGGIVVPLELVLFRIRTDTLRYYFMVFARFIGVDMKSVVDGVRDKLYHSGWYMSIAYDEEHDMIVMVTRVSRYEWEQVEDYSRVYVDSVEEEWFPGTEFWKYNSALQVYEPTFIIDKGVNVYVLWHYSMLNKTTGTDVELDIDRSFKKYMEHFSILWDTAVAEVFNELMARKTTLKEIQQMSYEEFNLTVNVLNKLGYRAESIGNGVAVVKTPYGETVYKLVGNETVWSTVSEMWNKTRELMGLNNVEPVLLGIERNGIYLIPFLIYLPLYPLYAGEYEKFVDLAVTDFKYVYPRLYAERVAEFLFAGAVVSVPRKCYIVPVAVGEDNVEAEVRIFDPVLNMTVYNGTAVYQEWRGIDAEYKAYVSIMLEYKALQVHAVFGNKPYDYLLMPQMSYMGYVYPLVYVPPDIVITNTTPYWDYMVQGEPGVKVYNRFIVSSEVDIYLNTTLIGRQYVNATLELEDGTVIARQEPYTKYLYMNFTYLFGNTTSTVWEKMPEIIQGEYALQVLKFYVFANNTILMNPSKSEQHLVLRLEYPGGGSLVYVLPIRYSDLFPSINFVGKIPSLPGFGIRITPEVAVGVVIATVFIYMLTGGLRRNE